MKQLPEVLLQELESIAGFNKAAFIEAHQRPPVISVRMNSKKPCVSFEHTHPVPWCAGGFYLNERPVFTLDPAFHAGAYYVQEASSMFLDHLVKQLLPERENLRVLDLCGAPGGKSTLLASLLPESSLLISNEVIRSRASVLEENMTRWGFTNNWVVSNDPKEFGKLKGYFDLIVADAPCSGSGLFRKDENALKEWGEATVTLCSQRQQRILADVWESLKEGGVLIYATCSYSPQEDEAILDWLSDAFSVAPLSVPVPAEWGIVPVVANGLTGYRFFPDKVEGEGFFIAAIQKNIEADTLKAGKFRSAHDEKAFRQAAHLVRKADWHCLPSGKGTFHAVHASHEPDWHLLGKMLYLRKIGLNLGGPAGKDWIPAHDVALSIDRAETIPSMELSREQALKFLKKEALSLSLPDKGWILVTYAGLGLGWIKSLGNRYNNYLPKHWRIRMQLPDEEWA